MVVAAGINQSIIALERQMQQLLSWDKYVKQNKQYIIFKATSYHKYFLQFPI
jgi:hypothetical protein